MQVWRTRFTGAAIAALMLAACSSGDSSGGTNSATGTCAPGVTDDSVKVGLLYPDTGVMAAQFTGFRAGVTARFGAENAAGGVGSRKIDYAWQDDQSDPRGNLQGACELVAQNAFAVVQYSAASQQSIDYLDTAGVPVVGVADQPGWGQHQNTFSVTFASQNGQSTTTLGDFVRQQGGTRAALAISFLSQTAKLYADGVSASLRHAGIGVVTQDVDSTNTADVAQKIIASGADTIIAAAPLDLYTGVLAAAVSAGHPFKVAVSVVSYDPRLLAPYGHQLAGSYAQLSFAALERDRPVQRQFLQAMATYSPEVSPPGQQSAIDGWLSADLFIRGLKTQQGCPTRDSYIKGLRAVSDYDADGMMVNKINFGTDRGKLDLCYDFVRVANSGDHFEVVSPQPLCGERIETDR
ncbi:amino acid/amide ABC transporter substrate-binding protein, HAAT family [Frankia torreyi]|uniref:Amino acid/amide ABC transporter substrate-binding protein, HAAT family n=1 Tax=Frankia torreyi TaxID=1856 RepID=A0A0D8BLK7_9ACTN|nr:MULTISPECIES: ABC transporter substrate-binding protein [Frankia]KJE25138.1 amino acid/amide ABC transporter substrate-binding protein, HAAT family [Frankia torreyi]